MSIEKLRAETIRLQAETRNLNRRTHLIEISYLLTGIALGLGICHLVAGG